MEKKNLRNKPISLICHHNYQTWYFSISYILPITLLINELGITMNPGISLTKLIVPPTFGLIVKTDSTAYIL